MHLLQGRDRSVDAAMSKALQAVLGDPTAFLDRLFAELAAVGIDVARFPLDHVCYRVASSERYAELKPRLATAGELLHEAMIGGRPIATYKLHEPIVYAGRRIDLVELPAPKPGRTYDEGYEHAEFVITESFVAFMARYPHVAFDTDGAHKPVNAELRVPLGALSVKFHHQSLEDVIARERA
jgi:predicted metalloenzyme YecM